RIITRSTASSRPDPSAKEPPMPRSLTVILLICSGLACVNNYYVDPNPGSAGAMDPGTSASPDGPDDPGDDPPTTPTTTSGAPGTTGDAGADAGDASTSTGAPAPMPLCGDGVVEGDEACDDGFAGNKNHLTCTTACEKARCGDGFVQAVLGETCD